MQPFSFSSNRSFAVYVKEWIKLQNMKKFLLKFLLIITLGFTPVLCLDCYYCDSRADLNNCHIVNAFTEQTNRSFMRVPAPLECLEMQFREVCK